MAKTAFLFPGQGSQSVGMAQQLVEQVPAAARRFDEASEILGFDLRAVCFEGPQEKLDSTDIGQPAIFVASLAAVDKLQADSPDILADCDVAAGLSLGEYTALVFSGSIDFEPGLRLVAERGRAMQSAANASPSGMVSVLGMDVEPLADLCNRLRGDRVLQIANYLCPGNLVVSGDLSACDELAEATGAAGASRAIPLSVAGAFHTERMQPAVARLTAALENVEIRPPRLPVVSNVDARPHGDPDEIRSLLIEQVVRPVRWEESIRWMLDETRVERFYEVGPGRVLRGLLRRISRKLPCENITA